MFRTVPLSIFRSFSLYTLQWYMSHMFAGSLRAGSGQNSILILLQAASKPVWHILLQCVQWKTPEDGQRNCPKHVEFYSKNKFEKLLHLVGFIIRIYHDAPSPERQNCLILVAFFFLILLLRVVIFHFGTYYKLYSNRVQVNILILICLTAPFQRQWLYILKFLITNS